MRNVFDQYDQPENKLTHALVCTLSGEPKLIRPFLRWLGVRHIPPISRIRLVEQQVPGVAVPGDEAESRGLPDTCFYDQDGWSVLIESKIQSGISVGQLKRHRATACRHGYEDPYVVLIAVDRPRRALTEGMRAVEWREVYRWFSKRASDCRWARMFVDYMHVFESRMVAQDYDIRGVLTMFDGLKFSADNPYTYQEGKHLIRLLGDELLMHKGLLGLGVDPTGKRRPEITGRGQDRVWDLLSLKVARGAKEFTYHPHLSIGINWDGCLAALTVPDRVKGGVKNKLKKAGLDGFRKLVAELEIAVRPVIKQSKGAKPMIYAAQHHYKSQRSREQVDARLDADLRTVDPFGISPVKYQPEWVDAIYHVLLNKHSNIQFGAELHFSYGCPVIRSRRAVDLFAQAWISMWPLAKFVLGS